MRWNREPFVFLINFLEYMFCVSRAEHIAKHAMEYMDATLLPYMI